MRFFVPCVIVFAALLQNTAPKQDTKSAHSQTHSNNPTDNTQPAGSQQVVYIGVARQNSNPNKTSEQTTTNQNRQNWWERPTVTDWILAFTTTCYLGVNIFMLIALKRQAKIAKQTADALMNAEQAVLVVDKGEWIFDGMDNIFRWTVANSGKTVATVFTMYGTLQIGASDKLPPDVSVYDHQPTHETFEAVVAPGSTNNVMWDIPLKPNKSMADSERLGILGGTKYLWACGFYSYRDIFGRPFTQRFCYRWNSTSQEFHPAGPWEYRRLI
jgi:hypothetical protein